MSLDTLKQNVETLIGEEQLVERLKSGRPLKVKLGVDPTRPDLTFGHMVVFNKLRQFQDAGHEAILIIGDFTTLIGDPSGRSSTRPVLTREEIKRNAETYVTQAFKILDESKTTVRYNSEWFDKMSFEDCLMLARKMTVARMLERDDFAKRHASNTPISIIEFLYPLVQGYDSLMIDADVELGGTDQTFNLLVGRAIQKDAGKPEQIVMTLPLLVGLDGEKKMSKSLDNYIAFNDSPKDMFGKIMSIGDDVMWTYYRLLLCYPAEKVEELKQQHPMQVKKDLARSLVNKLFGEGAGDHELEQFEKVFSQRELPDEMPEFPWQQLSETGEARLTDLMTNTNLFPSKKECRRLIEQGAVKIDEQKVEDPNLSLRKPEKTIVVQAGRRKFFRVLG